MAQLTKAELNKYFWYSSLILMHQLSEPKIKPGSLEELKQNYEHMRVSFQEVFPDVDWKLVKAKDTFDFWIDGVRFFQYVEENNVSEAASILKSFYGLVGL